MPSPVVELNRVVAVGMAYGPQTALDLLDELGLERSLGSYHLLFAVKGDLLARLGHAAEAKAEFERAAGMTQNLRERELMLARAQEVAGTR